MIDIKSSIQNLEIIGSGKAHLALGDTLKLNFSEEDPIKLEIKFLNDSSFQRKISWVIEETVLKISLQNFANSGGTGILHPWRIGSYLNKELFITCYSTSHMDAGTNFFIFDYIFYTGKEIENE